ncbi:Hypothetical Protein FCC1311_009342 [Hondaea fermentalgiana]|uniref:Uncharacterized protein n=1 Tax=Hondaea fermentalgiana TaxID=2315210 RepID=A0A2R5G118_9STRA|nr:Hypothetical Protein FCC1311_009342 [Hondaea fermentalgiana]|eukprot:GBG24716.1 Hypothetical Protein FCC1311_009342 [Hondaea fermentalgiana]
MLDAEALRTADAIDSLLQEAMSVRSEAVKRYKQAILEKDTYEHAQMYNSLHKLPREKIAMYTQICKFRREAAMARDQAQKSSKLFASERKQFREAQDAMRQRAERAEASVEEAQAQAGELRRHLAREEDRAAALETRLKDDLVRETAQRERLESELRRTLEEQRISFELQIAQLKSEKDELELMVDHFRGQAQASMLSVVEMKIGLQGVVQSTNNVTSQAPKRHGGYRHDEHWREAYVQIPGAKDVPKANCMSQRKHTVGRADPDSPSRRREETCSMP